MQLAKPFPRASPFQDRPAVAAVPSGGFAPSTPRAAATHRIGKARRVLQHPSRRWYTTRRRSLPPVGLQGLRHKASRRHLTVPARIGQASFSLLQSCYKDYWKKSGERLDRVVFVRYTWLGESKMSPNKTNKTGRGRDGNISVRFSKPSLPHLLAGETNDHRSHQKVDRAYYRRAGS